MSGDSAADLNKNKEKLKDGGSAETQAVAESSAELLKAADAGFGVVEAQAEGTGTKAENADDKGREAGNDNEKEAEGNTADAVSAESSEEPSEKEGFWTKSNIAGFIFILALIGFNLIIYSGAFSGSGDSPDNIAGINGEVGFTEIGMNQRGAPLSDGLPHDDDKYNGKPHPPAPPPGQNGKPDEKWTDNYIKPKNGHNRGRGFMSANSVLKCIIYLAGTDDQRIRLTPEQRSVCSGELKKLVAKRREYNELAAEMVSYFTPKQFEWYNKHRGEPEIPDDKKKGGSFDYLINSALEILKDRAGSSKATTTVYKHNFIDTMLNDIVSCIIKCEKEKDLKLSSGQAAAMLPIMPKLVRLEKYIDAITCCNICTVFNEEQTAWLSEHMNEINLDSNMVMLLYADQTLSVQTQPNR